MIQAPAQRPILYPPPPLCHTCIEQGREAPPSPLRYLVYLIYSISYISILPGISLFWLALFMHVLHNARAAHRPREHGLVRHIGTLRDIMGAGRGPILQVRASRNISYSWWQSHSNPRSIFIGERGAMGVCCESGQRVGIIHTGMVGNGGKRVSEEGERK